jgi:hypothetical protein
MATFFFFSPLKEIGKPFNLKLNQWLSGVRLVRPMLAANTPPHKETWSND